MEISKIIKEQRSFFDSGKTREISFRLDTLARLESAIEVRCEEILKALKLDLNKPKLEARLSEVFFLLQEIRLFRKKLKRWAKPQRVGAPIYFLPSRNEIRREPYGCGLIISAWNYPIQLSLSPLIAAVGAGNCAILKPSEVASASSGLLADIVRDVFEPGHVTVVEGDASVAKELLDQTYDYIFFTGSERIGKIVSMAAAENLTPTILELGGKCPVVVDKEIDIEKTAERVVSSKFFNAGQTCIAPDFVAAHQDIKNDLTEAIIGKTKDFYRNDMDNDLAAIINDSHYERLLDLLDGESVEEPIGEDDREKRRMVPRILPKAQWGSKVMEEEVFGPILPVLEYSEEEELVARLRKMSEPLALYLFSRNKGFCDRIANQFPSGTIGINDVLKQATNLSLPFGGVGGSGMGRYRGKHGFEALTYQRAVSSFGFKFDWFSIHPPYKDLYEKFARFLK